jgi:hypothetical protein
VFRIIPLVLLNQCAIRIHHLITDAIYSWQLAASLNNTLVSTAYFLKIPGQRTIMFAATKYGYLKTVLEFLPEAILTFFY